ncbi:TonB-dependent receptor [uncultured Flavobacterium sp.]|uniref:TonB-dependent receptor plug domain-containing protein n=1 Tax=uncultured Flavobacterium sp. TaxID=165435 RepID=UPI0025F6F247|nr:TonB-dependent receptor [uncultured Flavobacterium sp.]
MQNGTKALLYIFLFSGFVAAAQETVTDTIKPEQLEEVVVTGQMEPQSIKKSVFNVRVITRDDIQRQAGNNLADVLNQYLNIMVQPNTGEGRSTVSLFGLDGQYLKVLVDNIPLVSDTGLGNNVDLTQINLDDVERVEIIEGAMGVTHGANAVSGIINIITKKSSRYTWEINATAQEESIGNEYSPLKDKGRHIQALRVNYSIDQNWFVGIGGNRNDFTGFRDERGGRDHTDYDPATPDVNRGYSWLPKEQYFGNALVRYQKNNTRIFYRFDYFDEKIDFYNPIVENEVVDSRVLRVSRDRRFFTEKFYHHFNASGKLLTTLDYNVSLSHQRQKRELEQFNYYIQTGQEATTTPLSPYQDTEVLYSTGTLANFFGDRKFDMQLGYEFVNTNGYNAATGELLSGGSTALGQAQKQRLENYDVFAAGEYALTDRFTFRPGFRYSFQSKFEDQWSASMGLRYLFDRGIEARASFGRSYRTPNYDELYTYFVDSNHNVQGNENLIPETGQSVEASISKTTNFDSGLQLVNSLVGSYIAIDDRIELVLVRTVPRWEFEYINIDTYKMYNFATTHQLNYNNWQVKAGVAFRSTSKKIDTGTAVSDDKFLNTLQFNTSIGYTIPKWDTVLSLFYKLNGKQQQFVQVTENGNQRFILQEIESFGLLDASVKKGFFGNRLDATLGGRNLLNVVNIRSNVAESGAHDAGSTSLPMAYGRSFFLKLTYNLNF